MPTLLAQNIPGYKTDVPGLAAGQPSILQGFYDFFKPDQTSSSLGFLVSRILTFAIVASGLFFFAKLLSAGYTYLTSLGEPAKIQSASKELANAAIGLIVVISAFFLAQIIQVIFGINFL